MSGSDDSYVETLIAPTRRGAITLRHFLGSLRGTQNRFDSGTIHLGRRKDCDVQYNSVIDRMVSGRHARLTHQDGQWTIEDLGSTNGTLVNSVAVVGRIPLRHGDCVVLGLEGTDGSASFTVEIQSLEPFSAAPELPSVASASSISGFPETGFTYDCPGCGAIVPVPFTSIGLFARCVHCGNDHRVPEPGKVAEPAVGRPAGAAKVGNLGNAGVGPQNKPSGSEPAVASKPAPTPAPKAADPARIAELDAAVDQAERATKRAAADLASVLWHSGAEIDWSRCRSVPVVLSTERTLLDATSQVDAIDEELRRLDEAHRTFVAESERRRHETEARLERARHDKRSAELERDELAAEYDTRFTLVVERLDQLSLLIADFVARQRPNAEPSALSDLATLRLSLRNEGAALDPESNSTADVLARRDAAAARITSTAAEITTAEKQLAAIAKEGAAHDSRFTAERAELQGQLDRATEALAEVRTELSRCFATLGQEAIENEMPECDRHPQERAFYEESLRALRAARDARSSS